MCGIQFEVRWRKPLTEKLTFEPKLKGGEGRSHAVV